MDRLLASRLVLVTGKGGSGKTTFAAGLARLPAERGRRTIVIEVDAVGVGESAEPVVDGAAMHVEPRRDLGDAPAGVEISLEQLEHVGGSCLESREQRWQEVGRGSREHGADGGRHCGIRPVDRGVSRTPCKAGRDARLNIEMVEHRQHSCNQSSKEHDRRQLLRNHLRLHH